MVLERSRPSVISYAAGEPREPVGAPSTVPEMIADPAGSVTIALAQFYPRLGDVAANLAAHLTTIDGAAAAGAGLVVFPELSLTGYFLKDQGPEVALTIDSSEVGALRDASRERGVDVVAGLILESDEHRFNNA
ncbi:MAG: nitrilase-related carbon-nitrogen hydrolase, partial [Candidatus Dormiibacterota bacterium]